MPPSTPTRIDIPAKLFSGAPTGSCKPYEFAINTTNGNVYSCNMGVWQAITGGGSGVASLDRFVFAADYGAMGDGDTTGHDDTAAIQSAFDAAFGPVSSPNGTVLDQSNRVLVLNGKNGGYFKLTDSIKVKYLQGGRVMGLGRFVTTLSQFGTGVPVFETNGCGYSHFEGIRFWANTGQPAVELDWDGTAGGAALQSNTFVDCFFQDGTYGVRIGSSGFMGSETLFLNCFWISQTVAGIACANANALQQTIIGGNFQTCAIGVWVAAGSVNVINGVGFQQSSTADIQTESLVNNTMSVTGCRSESTNFIVNNGSQAIFVSACSHTSAGGSGDFYFGTGGSANLASCISTLGQVHAKYWAQIGIKECNFARLDWLTITSPWAPPGNETTLCLELESVNYGYGVGTNIEIRRQRILGDVDGVSTKTYEYDVTEVP